MASGTLRIYLGAAPGVGTTCAMLQEGHRLRGEGADVVIGLAEDHGRPHTARLREGLETVPARTPDQAGERELDVEAVVFRAPQVALVDDFAHTNSPGSRQEGRWQDVEQLLEAGIDVISTLDIQHLASLADVVESITGLRPAQTVPDEVVRRADQIELVDLAPELLRARVAAGHVYPREQVDTALANYFRPGNLAALRELALLWLAGRVDEGLEEYRAREGIHRNWPTRERVVVGLSGGPEGQTLIRRAARILAGAAGGELHAVRVRPAGGAAGESPGELEAQRRLVSELGGSWHSVSGEDPAQALLDFARSISATQIVIGVSRHKPLRRIFAAGVGARVVRDAGDIDVHMVSHAQGGKGLARRRPAGLGRARTVTGFVLALALPPVLHLLLERVPHEHFATDLLIHLTGTIAVALVGGLWPAVVAAVLSGIIVNFFTVPPVQTLTVSDPENVLTLVIFLAVAVAVSLVVGFAARLGRHARQAEAEAAALGELSRTVITAENSITGFLDHVREHFRADGAALYRREKDAGPGTWQLHARTGTAPGPDLEDADTVEPLDDAWALALTGTTLSQHERELLTAFCAHLLAMLQREQLDASYRDNLRLAEGNKMRTSILRAVSHDLRTPLAGIKLAVSSLRQDDVEFTPEEQRELLATIEDYCDRLESLVGNLLDMSRITGESLSSLIRPVHWADAVAQALRSLPDGRIRLELPDNMPAVDADPGMLERVIANIVENALKYAPDSEIVIVGSVGGTGSATIDGFPASELRIIDHGKGVPADQVVTMFKPFQRLDDAPAGTGIGLGLAVAKGLTEAMGGRLLAEPTPGGGLTMIIRLPLSTGVSGPSTIGIP